MSHASCSRYASVSVLCRVPESVQVESVRTVTQRVVCISYLMQWFDVVKLKGPSFSIRTLRVFEWNVCREVRGLSVFCDFIRSVSSTVVSWRRKRLDKPHFRCSCRCKKYLSCGIQGTFSELSWNFQGTFARPYHSGMMRQLRFSTGRLN